MKRKICPHCKTHNPEAAVFCKRCGALFRGEPEYKNENNFIEKNKNIIIVAVCAFLLIVAFIIFKAGSAPDAVATTAVPTEGTTASTTIATTTAPTTTLPPTTETTTEILTLPTRPSTTVPTTKATTTAAPTEEEIQEICDEYNTLIENLKYCEYEPTIHKTIETSLKITSFSLPVNTDTLNRFMNNLLPETNESYSFSADGIAAENQRITLEGYIPPSQDSSASVTAEDVKSATKNSDGTITLKFRPDSSSFANGNTQAPFYVASATDYLDFASFSLGSVGITKAEIEYPETVITAEVDSDNDIIKLSIKQPASINCTGGVGTLTADLGINIDTLTVFEVNYY